MRPLPANYTKRKVSQLHCEGLHIQVSMRLRYLPVYLLPQTEKPTDLKRLRMEKDALENMLFGLFEKQPTWVFSQLQRETDQPVPWLKVRLGMIRCSCCCG